MSQVWTRLSVSEVDIVLTVALLECWRSLMVKIKFIARVGEARVERDGRWMS